MTLEELTSKASKALESGADFDRRLKLDFGEDGLVFVDGASRRVSNEDAPADATLSMSYDDFKLIASGRLDPKNSAWLMAARTVCSWNGLVTRYVGSGRSPVRRRSG